MLIRKRWAVFISGRGSNLRALLQSGSDKISLVVTSKESAQGARLARRFGVPVLSLPKSIDWNGLELELKKYRITDVFLAGFMKVIPQNFLKNRSRVLNVHPSLLPAYPGLKSMRKSYDDAVDMGVTVHRVTEEVDGGEILLQKVSVKSKLRLTWDEAKLRTHIVEQRLVAKAFCRSSP